MDEQTRHFKAKLCSQLEIFNENSQLIKVDTYEENGKIYLNCTFKKKYNSEKYTEELRGKEFIMVVPNICLSDIYFNGRNIDDREVITITCPRTTLDKSVKSINPYVDLKASGMMET